MTAYEVLISRTALKQFEALERRTQNRIKGALSKLVTEPRKSGVGRDIKRLKGSGEPVLYRMRSGDYRIVYSIVESEVRVTGIFHRKRGYTFLE